MHKKDLEVRKYLKFLKGNGNLEKLGTNSDNKSESIHRWFSFLPGFSHLFVSTTLQSFNHKKRIVFDPFMGSATTAVVGMNLGLEVIGNESNRFLYKIGKAKTRMPSNPILLEEIKEDIMDYVRAKWRTQEINKEHPLLIKCYTENNLKKIISLKRTYLSNLVPNDYKPYIFVAISSLLSKCSNVGISIPYVSWNHKHIPEEPLDLFERNITRIKDDLLERQKVTKESKVKIYLHDSREKNTSIKSNYVDLVFTSPPYLNNFDYGEALKVYTHFWNLTKDWSDITKKIRIEALTSATTYYKEKEYRGMRPSEMLGVEMTSEIPIISDEIIGKIELINKAQHKKNRKKSFDILTALYFRDMFRVFKEIHRVTKKDGLCLMIIGDSAPYGVYVPTDEILGKMAKELGFSKYSLELLRPRGRKWLNLTHRHKVRLRESLLVIRK